MVKQFGFIIASSVIFIGLGCVNSKNSDQQNSLVRSKPYGSDAPVPAEQVNAPDASMYNEEDTGDPFANRAAVGPTIKPEPNVE